jgi:hypothetical protein
MISGWAVQKGLAERPGRNCGRVNSFDEDMKLAL